MESRNPRSACGKKTEGGSNADIDVLLFEGDWGEGLCSETEALCPFVGLERLNRLGSGVTVGLEVSFQNRGSMTVVEGIQSGVSDPLHPSCQKPLKLRTLRMEVARLRFEPTVFLDEVVQTIGGGLKVEKLLDLPKSKGANALVQIGIGGSG